MGSTMREKAPISTFDYKKSKVLLWERIYESGPSRRSRGLDCPTTHGLNQD